MLRIIKETAPDLYEQYKQKTKEINRENAKQWRNNNKEKSHSIAKKYKQKTFTCSCGETITNNNKSAHLKSYKHLKLLQRKQNSKNINTPSPINEEQKKESEDDELNRLSAEFDKLLGVSKY